ETIGRREADAAARVEDARAAEAANQTSRRAPEKDVAAVDSRLARFDDHRAAVKTNQEYTALLHEIAGAKGEKEALEDRILLLLEEADALAAAVGAAEAALADVRQQGAAERAAL